MKYRLCKILINRLSFEGKFEKRQAYRNDFIYFWSVLKPDSTTKFTCKTCIVINKLLFLLICILIADTNHSNAQNTKTDSLKRALMLHGNNDSVKVQLLNQMALEINPKDADKARSYAIQGGELSDSINYQRGKSESLYLIGLSYSKTDKQTALRYLKDALSTAEKIGYKSLMSKCLNAIGNANFLMGQNNKAIEYYQQAIAIMRSVGDNSFIGHCITNLSKVYDRTGNAKLALEGYNEAIEYFIKQGDKQGEANCYNIMGVLYQRLGNVPLAIDCHQRSIKIQEEKKDSKGVSANLINLAGIYHNQKDYKKTIEYNQKALQIAQELDDKHMTAGCLLNIGSAYLQTNNPQALEYLQRALAHSETLKIMSLKIEVRLVLGNYYSTQKDFGKALKFYTDALKISETIDLKSTISEITSKMASVYFAQNQYALALKYARNSLSIANTTRQIGVQKEAHKLLADIYAATNRFEKAYSHSKQYKKFSDSIYNESNVRQIAEFEYQYKYEKEKQILELDQQKRDAVQAAEIKQQQTITLSFIVALLLMMLLVFYIYRSYRNKKLSNILLTQQKTEIETKNKELTLLNEEIRAQKEEITSISRNLELQNTELQTLNATKDKFFGIIAHDLKNPFNAILGFLDLLTITVPQNTPEQTLEQVGLMQASAKNAYKLLENLLEWARTQTGAIDFKPQQWPLKNLVAETIAICGQQAKEKNISISDDIPGKLMVYADRNMLSTILRNLVTNAIKFTHKDGSIIISCSCSDDITTISVADNGIGMDESTRTKLFRINEKISILGTEQERGTGIGLLLCKEFVEKHGGHIWIESEVNQGSNFKFTIPNRRDTV